MKRLLLFTLGLLTCSVLHAALPSDSIIVDDKDTSQVTFKGLISNSGSAASWNGSSTKLDSVNTSAFYSPDSLKTGHYQIFVWNRAGGWPNNVRHYLITGQDTFLFNIVNQQANPSKWAYLGSANLDTNSGAGVLISRTAGVTNADAIMFLYKGPIANDTITLDNQDSRHFAVNDFHGNKGVGYFSQSLLLGENNKSSTDSATFSFVPRRKGFYKIIKIYQKESNGRASIVPIDIIQDSFKKTVIINQNKATGMMYDTLGTYYLEKDILASVSVYGSQANDYFYADAVRFIYQGESDSIAPSKPDSLSSDSITISSVKILWNEAEDNFGISGYNIYQDGAKIDSMITHPYYNVTGLSDATQYTFIVEAVDLGNNKTKSDPIVVTTLQVVGIEDAVENKTRIYPNPAVETLLITNAEGMKATVYSIIGEKVFESIISSGSIDVSLLAAGKYLLEVGSKTYSFIK